MIRYRYVVTANPPAPYVNVALQSPISGRQVDNLPAQIDIGADRTILPGPIVANLGLQQSGHELFQGFGSQIIELPTFLAIVLIHDLPPATVLIAMGELETHVLLGRDVLNQYRILLDGPNSILELGESLKGTN